MRPCRRPSHRSVLLGRHRIPFGEVAKVGHVGKGSLRSSSAADGDDIASHDHQYDAITLGGCSGWFNASFAVGKPLVIRRQVAATPRTMLTPLCVGTPSEGSIDMSTIGYLA